MDCRTFHRRLEDYLEGGMDFPARFGMERHAKQCYACEKDVHDALKLRQKVRAIPRVVAPSDFETSLLARIKAEKARHRFWSLQSIWLYSFDGLSPRAVTLAVAAVVLLVGTVSYLHFGAGWNDSSLSRIGTLNPLANDPNREDIATEDLGAGTSPVRLSELSARGDSLRSWIGSPNLGGLGNMGWDSWATPYSEPGDSDYFEYLVPVSGERQLILQLPKTIRIRYNQPSERDFMWNMSH